MLRPSHVTQQPNVAKEREALVYFAATRTRATSTQPWAKLMKVDDAIIIPPPSGNPRRSAPQPADKADQQEGSGHQPFECLVHGCRVPQILRTRHLFLCHSNAAARTLVGASEYVINIPRSSATFLAFGLLAVSQSGNIIRISDAHPVAIAGWRLLLATLLLAPFALRAGGLRVLDLRGLLLLGAAGVTLALHFFTWIAAVQETQVANAALLFSLSPVLTAAGGRLFFGERVTRRLAISIGLGVLGVAVIGWSDLRMAPDHILGDGLALLTAVFFAIYTLLGRQLRGELPTATYVASIYGVAAVVSFGWMMVGDIPLVDYEPRDWWCFMLMAAVPTGIGHTGINHALRYLSAARLSVLTLVEPPLAAAVAWWVWEESITGAMFLGFGLIAAAVLLLVTERPPISPTQSGHPKHFLDPL